MFVSITRHGLTVIDFHFAPLSASQSRRRKSSWLFTDRLRLSGRLTLLLLKSSLPPRPLSAVSP